MNAFKIVMVSLIVITSACSKTETNVPIVPNNQTNGSISGYVTDQNSQPYPGLDISVSSSHSTITNSNGYYKLKDIPPGDYILKATIDNTTKYSTNISVGDGVDVVKDFVVYKDDDIKLISCYCKEDSYIDQSYPNSNYGSELYLYTRYPDLGAYIKIGLNSFRNLQNITISEVKLTITEGFNNSSPYNKPTGTLNIYSVADNSWTENGITFNNAPSPFTSVAIAKQHITFELGQSYTFDITNYFKYYISSTTSDYITFSISTIPDNGYSYAAFYLYSREVVSATNRIDVKYVQN